MNITEHLSDISLNYFSLVRKLASKFDLTLSQTLVLLYIPFDGITISDLSDKLGIDISTMTRNIQRIEKKGLINTAPDQDADQVMEISIEAGAEDIEVNDDDSITVSSSPEDFEKQELRYCAF